MCNKVHRDESFKEVSSIGTAYKIVRIKNGRMYPIAREYDKDYTYKLPAVSFPIRWEGREPDRGFCFFPTLKETRDVAREWTKLFDVVVSIVKVKYRKGLGSFKSRELDFKKRTFLIAKEWEVRYVICSYKKGLQLKN